MFGFESSVIAEYWPLFVHGAWTTVQVTIICVCLGMCLGTLLGMGRLAQARYNPLKGFLHYCVRWPITVYVSFFRGTPLFVQIFLMYFAVLPVFIHPVDGLLISGQLARDIRSNYGAMLAGVCAITLNSGAYMCEIFRAGIQSLDKGQMEGGQAIGMSYLQIMLHVIIPQAFRNLIPQIGNTYVSAIKDTSVLNVIAVTELYFTARTVTGTYYKFFETYCIVSVIYFVCTFVISRLLKLLEKFMAGSSNYELITESEEEVSK